MQTRFVLFARLISVAAILTVAAVQAGTPHSTTPEAVEPPIAVTTVASGLEHPWALAFLPDGRMLVTERPGRLRIVTAGGQLSKPLAGVPKVYARGQGGLLDVAISPDFNRDQIIFLSYSEPGKGGVAGTAVARGTLRPNGLAGTEVIWRQTPKVNGPNHWGSRLVFRSDGTLFVTVGDRAAYRDQAQNPSNTLGKLIRINPDGSIPKDNPLVGQEGAMPEIWSLGHRNVQGAALQPGTNELWTIEHGARGGDELNNPQSGRNYGWPVITYGIDYSGAQIGTGTAKKGMEQPVYYWDPVIAPSGALFYTGGAIPAWKGNLFVGSLSPGALVRLELKGRRVVREERYAGKLKARIRDVQQGPDGLIYVITDSPRGQIMRLEPAGGSATLHR